MGQEREEEAELIATIQHDHVKMKQWYNESTEAKSTLHSKYGSTYPSFWRDVISWNGWKESRKLFLKAMESRENNATSNRTDFTGDDATCSTNDTANNNNAEDASGKRKRRSRWGNSNDNATNDTSNSNDANTDLPPKRKSRWGDRGRDETAKPNATNSSSSSSVLDILPGLPTNLNAEQSGQLKELQSLLREANQRLENLEVQAARIDALPKGHPDRSPSPPPGKYINIDTIICI